MANMHIMKLFGEPFESIKYKRIRKKWGTLAIKLELL